MFITLKHKTAAEKFMKNVNGEKNIYIEWTYL